MKFKFLLLPLLLSLSLHAKAGIIANVNIPSSWHVSMDNGYIPDGQPGIPFSGTLSSNLQKSSPTSCKKVAGGHTSFCSFDADLSGVTSPYDAAYLSRFSDGSPAHGSLMVALHIHDDGTFDSTFTFVDGKYEEVSDDTTSLENSFTVNYGFQFLGSGIASGTAIDADLAAAIWAQNPLFHASYGLDWSVNQVDLTTGNSTTIAFEAWRGDMNAEIASIPEPSSVALLATGLLGLATQRGRRREN